uniref:Uncharacterized protein n=1 Tax=Desulfobacca acetoxidans TaxID=60893 RepID=A0A7C3Z9X7_9BACT
MIKRLQEFWARLRGDRGRLRARIRVDFYLNKSARSLVDWHDALPQERDPVSLAIFLYARILYELAELNETRAAKELMVFLTQVVDLVLSGEGSLQRPRLPLGELTLQQEEPAEPPSRSYQAEFFQQQDGQYFVDLKGSLGKEGIYLPAAYVVFLQDCFNRLDPQALRRLAQSLARLHDYYKLRRDFWDSAALAGGPLFALGTVNLDPEGSDPEAEEH